MIFGILKENEEENRVSLLPEGVDSLIKLGQKVIVESGAGLNAFATDDEYKKIGAMIGNRTEIFQKAECILKINPPVGSDLDSLRSGVILMGVYQPLFNPQLIKTLSEKKVSVLSLDTIPRTTRAQSMDVLSSMSTISGYKAVLMAANHLPKFFPMLTTAAGTIAPAKALILGAGVAGLQAIATAKRMGAVVYATDVRYATKEQVESLGGKFIVVDEEKMKAAQTAGGYAKEMDDDFKRKQAEAVRAEVAKSDIVITTALIPGKPAPRLVAADVVALMKAGSVIVDLAAEAGGNVEGTVKDQVVTTSNGVTILGYTNMSSRLGRDASSLFAKNILNFITLMLEKGTGNLKINWDDELIKGTLVTKDGQVVHPSLAG